MTPFQSSVILLLSLNIVSSNDTSPSLFDARIVGIFVSKSELQVSLEVLKPTILLAVQEVSRRYPHIKFDLAFRNGSTSCTSNYAGVFAAEEYYVRRVTAFVGPACSLALDPVGRMAAYWNVPTYTAGGVDTVFSEKSIFSTLTRLSFSLDQVSNFLKRIVMEFDWHHMVIITDEAELSEQLLKRSLADATRPSADYEMVVTFKDFSSNDRTTQYQKILVEASRDARVFVLVAAGDIVRHILLEAHALGMGGGEFAFLSIELIKNKQSTRDFSWYQPGDKRNKEARKMYESLMIIAVQVPVSEEYQIFVRRVVEMAQNQLAAAISPSSINPVVAAFYDSVLMYAWSLNKTLFEGGDPTDGYTLSRILWNTTFVGVGLTGDIFINENGDREADYTLNDLDPETGIMIPVAAYIGVRRVYEKIDGSEIKWPGNNGPPPDIPYCGFTGDAIHCVIPTSFPVGGMITITMGILAVLGAAVGFLIYRKLRLEAQLADLWWRIRWEDIEFIDQSHWRSTVSFTLKDDIPSCSTKPSTATGSMIPTIPGVLIGLYKGCKVAVKPLSVNKLHLPRAMLMEMKQMREVAHENLLRFVGLCIDEPNIAIVNEFTMRGTLPDMLQNDAMNIDWMFRYSMITDISEGMNFLQNSFIEYHGRLRSDNCLIDGRFVVKLSDFGMRFLYSQIIEEEIENPRILFWTAPEHLRQKDTLKKGSKKGDVYSFAIILQEIITRCGPFESLERLGRKHQIMEPEEILDRVRMGTSPPFRPEIAPDECPPNMLALLRLCWAENPETRPSFPEIKAMLKKITKGVSSGNFLDNLLNRMEQYANNLEGLVEEKTQSLLEEKKKTDELLFQMIPKYVAEELKKGCHVKPEMFDSVTIFFSDIVGFTSLSAESTPMEVVDLLNDLYSCFDAIIENYDVYKVETIGDAYMVASGLPVRNGHEHAREIARLSLHLLSAIGSFRIRHRPNRKLKLRIGIHSGSCVAGVVGLKMPRYCLFGDTVNTASRMESTSEALKIHISQQTKNILETFGIFVIISRGEVEIKTLSPVAYCDRTGGTFLSDPNRQTTEEVTSQYISSTLIHLKKDLTSPGPDDFAMGKGLMKTYWLEAEHS